MWNPKGRRGNFPLPQCISRVLGCWPEYTETGRTRDSAGQSSGVVSGDVITDWCSRGAMGEQQGKQKRLKFKLKKEDIICNLDEMARA